MYISPFMVPGALEWRTLDIVSLHMNITITDAEGENHLVQRNKQRRGNPLLISFYLKGHFKFVVFKGYITLHMASICVHVFRKARNTLGDVIRLSRR